VEANSGVTAFMPRPSNPLDEAGMPEPGMGAQVVAGIVKPAQIL